MHESPIATNDARGKPKSGNHRVIGSSQTYSSKAKMENGIKSVMKNGNVKKKVIV